MLLKLISQMVCTVYSIRNLLAVFMLLLGSGESAWLCAQAAPQAPNYGAGSAIQQTIPPPTTSAQPTPTEAEVQPTVVSAEPEKPMTLNPNETLLVNEIIVGEDDEEVRAKVERIVTPYLHRELTMAEINEAASRVTRYYRHRGYIVAKAYFPKQDASDGVLEMHIALGSYGNVTVKNRSRLRDEVVEGEFHHLKNSSPDVTAKSLERTVLLMRAMPGGAIPNVTLAPGKLPGTTDMQVQLNREGHRYQGYLLGDNQGSRFTGRKRLFGELDVNSPLGLADKFSVSGMLSEGERLHNVRMSYDLPLNYSGLRLMVAASRTRYALGGSYSALNATGSVSAVEGTFSYPLLLRHDSNIDLSLNVAHRDLHDNMSAVKVFNPRTAEVGTATLQRTKFGTVFRHRFYTSTGATVTVGEMSLNDATEAKSTGTNGDYAKLVINLSAETPLYNALSVRVSAVGQKDLRVKYLDSSEQLYISGSGGVRAYVEGISGDNGYIFNMELPYALPKIPHTGLQHAVSGFFDSGGVHTEKEETSLTDFVLNDAGVSYTMTRYPLFFKVQGVRMLGNIHSETDKTRMWMQLGFVF
jgi:hemolysin activation/secretion protein